MMRRHLAPPVLLLLATAAAAPLRPAPAQESTPSSPSNLRWVPRPNATAGSWVVDPSSRLASETRYRVNQEIASLRRATGTEIAVVLVDSTAGMRPTDLAIALRDAWGIGQSGNDNGIMFLVVPPRRDLRLIVGRPLRQTLTEARLGRIEDQVILAEFRRGDLNAGVLRGVRELVSAAREAAAAASRTTTARRSTTPATTPAPSTTVAPTTSTARATTPLAPPFTAAPATPSRSGAATGGTAASTGRVPAADSARRVAAVAAAFGADPGAVERTGSSRAAQPRSGAPVKGATTPPAAPAMKTATAPPKSAQKAAPKSTAAASPTSPPASGSPSGSPSATQAASGTILSLFADDGLLGTPAGLGLAAVVLVAAGAAIGALAFRGFSNRRAICPSCARRALRSDTRLVREAGPGITGADQVTERCDHCRWSRRYERSIPALPVPPTARVSGPSLPPPSNRRTSSGVGSGV